MNHRTIYMADAVRLLEDGEPHDLELWKLSNGEIVTFTQVISIKEHKRKGSHTLKFPNGQIRTVRDITLRYIDNLRIYY